MFIRVTLENQARWGFENQEGLWVSARIPLLPAPFLRPPPGLALLGSSLCTDSSAWVKTPRRREPRASSVHWTLRH